MAKVFLPRGLRPLTDGIEQTEVPAANVRELIATLDARFPGIGKRLSSGMAISIDGEIIESPLLEEVGPDSEVHFLPSLSGG